jgi:hemerythrin-like domain-containing protein
MTQAPTLLNDDGSASMATALLMSHHGMRRDLVRFAGALEQFVAGDRSRVGALAAEWQSFRGTLHGHHEAEDHGLFPSIVARQPDLAALVERLGADHRRIDPLLERGDQAFADLGAQASAAAAVVKELRGLLDEHLALEEAGVTPFLREAKQFPAPATELELDLYAQGFAWSCDGIAEEVLERLFTILPSALTAKLPDARVAFGERARRVWGAPSAGASRTSIPESLVSAGRR